MYGRIMADNPNMLKSEKNLQIVGPKAYVVRWGSWTKALLAFIEKVNSDISERPIEKEVLKADNSKSLISEKEKYYLKIEEIFQSLTF